MPLSRARVFAACAAALSCNRLPPGAVAVGTLSVSESNLARVPELAIPAEQVRKEMKSALERTRHFAVREGASARVRLDLESARRLAGDDGAIADVQLVLELTATSPEGDPERTVSEGAGHAASAADAGTEAAVRLAAFEGALRGALDDAARGLAARGGGPGGDRRPARGGAAHRDDAQAPAAARRAGAVRSGQLGRPHRRGLPLHAGERRPRRRGAPRRDRRARRAAPQARGGQRARRPPAAPEVPLKRSVFLLLALASCKAAETRDEPPAPSGADPAIYYPLALGNSWTYEYTPGARRETIQIVGRDGPWFVDDHRGRVRADAEGVRDADQYLLHAPLTPGAHWTAVQNLVVQHFTVAAVDATVKTRAGAFSKCVVVRNESPLPQGAGKFVTEWTYAPHVGLVQVRTQTVSSRGTQEQSRLDLAAYRVQ